MYHSRQLELSYWSMELMSHGHGDGCKLAPKMQSTSTIGMFFQKKSRKGERHRMENLEGGDLGIRLGCFFLDKCQN